jgi:hypothetical protein
MIRGNVMDTFTVSFRDGTKVSFVAKDLAHAVLIARELYDMSDVVMIERIGEWEDED